MATNVTFLTARESDAATFSSGSWVSTLPLANLQDQQPTNMARSTDATIASTRFDIDAGAAVDWDMFYVARAGLTSAAQLELAAAASQGGLDTPASTTGAVSAWPTSGKPTTPPGKVWFDVVKFGSLGSWRWRRVLITDTANPALRVDLGRALWGKSWRPNRPHSYGTGKGGAPADLRIVTPQGHTITDPGLQPRLWEVAFNFMSEADAEDNLEDLTWYCGTARDVAVCLDPEATTRLHRQMMLATFDQAPRVVRKSHKIYALVCVLREQI